MTEVDKKLLLIDLCGRLPHGVKVDHFGTVKELIGIMSDIAQVGYDINDYEDTAIEDIKPYLRPLSSMTEKEEKVYARICYCDAMYEQVNWLNAHHFDFRNLIKRGLAIEAPDGMYNLNKEQYGRRSIRIF